MKSLTLIFCTLSLLFVSTVVNSQEAVDKVHMLNGDINEGTVKGITEQSITFIYKGESLEYTFEKTKVNKIVFGSGRTQVINHVEQVSAAQVASFNSKNKLAVIPFVVISNEGSLTTQAMGEEVQHTTYDAFTKNTRGVEVLDPMTTNALLLKHNLNANSIKAMMPQEVAQAIGVEYVVYGSANINYEGSQSFGSTTTRYKDKEERDKGERKSSGKEFSSSTTSTTEKYDTTIEMNIFNDQGQNVYNVKRNGFGNSLDQYKATINYIVKRCPWGDKR
ncbi:hypothetical protein [Allomuricauda sp. NBRC 101325]|uniref:hypothetical protein n=1 Tax=Allomuricauda sp. NBRC 101325 TaxID=1113758 RepID=UPI0024A37BED|nr:hypothetical protein [Muricauda sp. NBRC 101325]GLU45225.1 hypothetical protein Musp01_28490 [Muricauda sp. NBRC 101325]